MDDQINEVDQQLVKEQSVLKDIMKSLKGTHMISDVTLYLSIGDVANGRENGCVSAAN